MSDPRQRMAEQLSAFAGEPYGEPWADETNGQAALRKLKAFGAGVIDPLGATSGLLNMIPTDITRNTAAKLQETRGNSPSVANAGSIASGLVGFGAGTAMRGVQSGRKFGDVIPQQSLVGEALWGAGYAAPVGVISGASLSNQLGGLINTNMRYPNRAQARYPRDGF